VSGPRPLDVGRIVEALDRHHVDYLLVYLLVGGVAATAHGAERLTADTVVRRTTANLKATAAVLRELHAYLLVEGVTSGWEGSYCDLRQPRPKTVRLMTGRRK
jgi:hypothetical protein